MDKTSEKKQTSQSFYANNIKKYWKNQSPPSQSGKFTDPLFPPNNNSILSKDKDGNFIDKVDGPTHSKDIDVSQLSWKRIDDIFGHSLIFQDEIECNDIKQGNLGNCYFLSALSAITEFPGMILQIFRTREKNNFGYFEVVLFIDGEWQVVVLDDYFVVDQSNTLKFCRPNGREIWVIILEKAWAKVNGGYVNTIAGQAIDALVTLTGFSSDRISIDDKTDKEEIWKTLLVADQKHNIMCTSTRKGKDVADVNLVDGHAYTLIGAKQLGNLRLLKIRNPWGYKEWQGAYSDKSKLWTEEKKQFFKYEENNDDGTFFMTLEDWLKYFTAVHICHVMYDTYIKSYEFKGNQIREPQVLNFYLPEDSKVAISSMFRFWRFNRNIRDEEHPCSIVIGKYDDKNSEITNVTGDFKTIDNVELIRDLKKGYYVIWVYCNYNACSLEPKPENYILRVMSSCSFRLKKVGVDSGFNLIKKMVTGGIREKFKSEMENSDTYFYKIENNFQNTGIGYLFVKVLKDNTNQTWNSDATGIVEMNLFNPYHDKSTFSFTVPSKGYHIVLGMRRRQYGTFWYNIKNTFTTKTGGDQPKLDGLANDTSIFLTTDIKNQDLTNNYFDYISSSNRQTRQSIQFESLDIAEVEMSELQEKYPDEMEKVLEFEPDESLSEENHRWVKYDYGPNQYYIGQFNDKQERDGRGIYTWVDDNQTYCGYWRSNVKDIYGTLSANGKITYQGGYKDGKKSGMGGYNFPNGDRYEGIYVNDMREGKGTYYWKSGLSWTGQCEKNQLKGPGKMKNQEGKEWDASY